MPSFKKTFVPYPRHSIYQMFHYICPPWLPKYRHIDHWMAPPCFSKTSKKGRSSSKFKEDQTSNSKFLFETFFFTFYLDKSPLICHQNLVNIFFSKHQTSKSKHPIWKKNNLTSPGVSHVWLRPWQWGCHWRLDMFNCFFLRFEVSTVAYQGIPVSTHLSKDYIFELGKNSILSWLKFKRLPSTEVNMT